MQSAARRAPELPGPARSSIVSTVREYYDLSAAEFSLINQLGAAITAAMGLLGLVFPNAAAKLVGLEAVTAPGRSEFRATYGGFFLAMGLAPLLTGAPAAALVGAS